MSAVRSFKLTGLVPAAFTPMKANGDVDYDKMADYCQYLVDNGITQVFGTGKIIVLPVANGTTAEAFSLSIEERKKVAEKWIEVGRKSGKLKAVVIQVGALNLHDTLALAKHAAEIGADAIATCPLLFFKPKTTDALLRFCKTVASAAPNLPFYFYHVPINTGVQLNMEAFLKAATAEIPNLVGLKFTDKDLVDMIGCIHVEAPHRDDAKYNILYGTDAQLMAGLVTGADGGVGSTYNILPNLFHRLIKNVNSGNLQEARRDQHRQQQFFQIMSKYGIKLGNKISAEKAVLAMAGLNIGPVRAPLLPPSAEELDSIKSELEKIGFFEWK